MGTLRFQVARREWLTDRCFSRIYIAGFDDIPWATVAYRDGELLVVEREASASGCVHCPWIFTGLGEQMVSTATLMERDRPYLLEVELARGTLGQIRNQLAAWQLAGLVVPDEITQRLGESSRSLSRAVALQDDPPCAADEACRALEQAVRAAELLVEQYSQQALALRQRETPRLPTLLGIQLAACPIDAATADAVTEAFNTAVISVPWRHVEREEGRCDFLSVDQHIDWCQRRGMKICVGPLLQFDASGIPDWLVIWDGDFENVVSIMLDHVRTVVSRYRGGVHLWYVAARMNLGHCLSLTDQQKLEAVLQAMETTRTLDPRTPVVVSLDQPWGEYMVGAGSPLSPLHYADALVRADVGLSALGLEINAGYFPAGTLPRSLLDYSRQLDRWSLFGMPLLLAVTTPSSTVASPNGESPARENGPRSNAGHPPATISPDTQRDWVASYVRLMLSKPSVQGIVWNQLCDVEPQDFPHSGLFDRAGKPKPVLDALRQIREEYLT